MFPTVSGRRSEGSGGRGARVNVVASAVLLGSIVLGLVGSRASGSQTPLMVMLVVGAILMQAPRIAQQWERAVVLRLGRRADPDLRHGAGQCRRGPVLDGARRAEGRARSAGLLTGRELGGADGPARHHRQDDFDRTAAWS